MIVAVPVTMIVTVFVVVMVMMAVIADVDMIIFDARLTQHRASIA